MNSSTPHSPALSYRDAGVDIDAGNRLVDRIKPHARRTLRPGVLGGLGGFGALFELPLDRYRQPVLVSGADGVGTKLKLALELNRHDTLGIDLVAMCANDVLVVGAEPLFFLDYYATGNHDGDYDLTRFYVGRIAGGPSDPRLKSARPETAHAVRAAAPPVPTVVYSPMIVGQIGGPDLRRGRRMRG